MQAIEVGQAGVAPALVEIGQRAGWHRGRRVACGGRARPTGRPLALVRARSSSARFGSAASAVVGVIRPGVLEPR